MKKTLNSILAFSFLLVLSFTVSCKKKDDKKTGNGFSEQINAIISEPLMDSLRKKGMTIHEGNNPPNVVGIYLVTPFTLVAPYGPNDGWETGHVINDYKYNLYDQADGEVKVDYKQIGGSDNGNGLGSFISGSGNKFSIFSELSGSDGDVTYTHVAVLSGEITSDGIKDFQYGFILTKKQNDDDNSQLIPVGSSRIWDDGDGLAEKTGSFRIGNFTARAGLTPFSIGK